MNLTELKKMPVNELVDMAQTMLIEGVARARKQEVIFAILKAHAKSGESIGGEGVLEILQDGFGFLRAPRLLLPGRPGRCLRQSQPDPPLQFAHRRLHHRQASARPKEGERYFALLKVDDINDDRRSLQDQGPVREPDAAVTPPKRSPRARQWLAPRTSPAASST
jgi:transcription termination factor Rho